MRDFTSQGVQDPGAVPGASTDVTRDSIRGIGVSTPQQGVEIAKVVPGFTVGGDEPFGAHEGGEYEAEVPEKCTIEGCECARSAPSNLCELHQNPVIRWCPACLEEGDHTAIDISEPEGSKCALHRRDGINKCARKGCAKEAVSGVWCGGHARCNSSVSCDNLPSLEEPIPFGLTTAGRQESEAGRQRRRKIARQVRNLSRMAFEAAWESLAEDSSLDPVTVATCKRIRDAEVLS